VTTATKKVHLQVKVSPELVRYLRCKAGYENRDISDLVEEYVRDRCGEAVVAEALTPARAS